MRSKKIGVLHYSAPPVVGGVESVIKAHVDLLLNGGYQVTVIAGDINSDALPDGANVVIIPELSTRHPLIVESASVLEQGTVPPSFGKLVASIESSLSPVTQTMDLVIVHNIFTKHFNLPFTAALFNILDRKEIRNCIAWCHDFTWTSPNSRSKVFPRYPWDLLRTQRDDVRYVTISKYRQLELAGMLECSPDRVEVIYNGVTPRDVLGLSNQGLSLVERLDLWESDLILLMPVRVTQAKNIEIAIHVAAILKENGIRPRIVLTGPPDPHDHNNMSYFNDLLALRQEVGVEKEMCFVYESGPDGGKPFVIDMQVVGDLYRVSDALFMPSHREGFGMPILEAGLVGLPVFCSSIPAADELGGSDVTIFPKESDPRSMAKLILDRMEKDPGWRLRRRVRQNLTWQSVFRQKILPLLEKGVS